MIIRNIATSVRFLRELGTGDLRTIAQDYADGVLLRYGYARPPHMALRALATMGTFGAGVAVGAGLGLLFAPAAGVETRKKVASQMQTAMSRAKQTFRRRANGHVVTDDREIHHPRGPIGHT